MGISSDGQICFGIAFEEEYEFPWTDEKWGGDEEDWWFIGVCGYVPPFEIFNDNGDYADGVRPHKEKMDEYYAHRQEFRESHPIPVEIVRHCSYEYTMFIVAVPGTYISAFRGNPLEFRVANIDPSKAAAVIDFCEKYCRPKYEHSEFPEMKPCWLLSSMYG